MQACDTTILISYFADFFYLVEFKRILTSKKVISLLGVHQKHFKIVYDKVRILWFLYISFDGYSS